jgi:O-antigen biosynthesis protein
MVDVKSHESHESQESHGGPSVSPRRLEGGPDAHHVGYHLMPMPTPGRGAAPATGAELYGKAYYESHFGGPAYERSDHWLTFFGRIADRLVADMAPGTFLDAGCAMGFLVESMYDRGVDAEGIDISDYAVAQAREDVRDRVRVGSILEPFGKRYDLISCIETLEHLAPADAERAVANLCAHTDDIIFTSTPDDHAEPTHLNVRPAEYWVELFARQGFFRDVDYDATFVISWAVRFRRSTEPVHLLVKGYERAMARLQAESAARHQAVADREMHIAERQAHIAILRGELAALQAEIARLRGVNADLARVTTDLSTVQSLLVDAERSRAELIAENDSMRAALDSVTWRLGQRVRNAAERVAPPASRRGRTVRRTARAALILGEQGPRGLVQRVRHRDTAEPADAAIAAALAARSLQEYRSWLAETQPTPVQLRGMRAESDGWERRPRVSIVLPVYNAPPELLSAAIDSVLAQAYSNWELCIADDGSTRHEVRDVIDEYAAREPRIKTLFRDSNGGISAASNSALQLATGELVGLLDHDDVLAPQALYRMVAHANAHPEHALIYSDEDKLRPDGSRADAFFKPDWSPELFASVNYLCHFTVMRRDVVEQVGGFRVGYEGSQDYDLFLRVVDSGAGVGHVPDVLYSWRQVPGSTAVAVAEKPAAYDAGRRAIEDSLRRRGIDARVDVGRVPTRYEVRRTITGTPLVSIVIPTRDRAALLRKAIESIEEHTAYPNYRILIVDNDSREAETLDYLRSCDHQVIPQPGPFNYSKIVNAGVAATDGEHVLLLNNDVEVVDPQWMEAMLEHSQRPEVGAVGARLLLPDGRAQHEGIGVGLGWLAGNLAHNGYFELGLTTRDCSGVTGACMMVRREVWDELGGLDETLHVAFNDVDFCFRIRERGYWIVYTPLAELYHHESASRGRLHPMADEKLLIERWGTAEQIYDPFVNANLLDFNPLRLRRAPKRPSAPAAAPDSAR